MELDRNNIYLLGSSKSIHFGEPKGLTMVSRNLLALGKNRRRLSPAVLLEKNLHRMELPRECDANALSRAFARRGYHRRYPNVSLCVKSGRVRN